MTMPKTIVAPLHHYLNDGYGIKSWLLTRDHKRIGLLYLAAITVFFFIGLMGLTIWATNGFPPGTVSH